MKNDYNTLALILVATGGITIVGLVLMGKVIILWWLLYQILFYAGLTPNGANNVSFYSAILLTFFGASLGLKKKSE